MTEIDPMTMLDFENDPAGRLIAAYEAILREMRTHARADRTIALWVDRLDLERDEFLQAMERRQAEPLRVTVAGNLLPISIGTDTLAKAIELGPQYNRPDGSSAVTCTDPVLFARGIAEALQDEAEDGTTPVHRLLDAAAERAIENGCEGVEYDEGEPEGHQE